MGVIVDDVDGVRRITLDRPEVANAIDLETAIALDEAVQELERRSDLRAGVLAATGRTFCAGKDLRAHAAGAPEALVDGRGFAGLTRARRRTPVVAAVDGPAVGGGVELVLACDLVVASTRARFALAEVGLGMVASEGGLVRTVRRLPRPVAADLLLTGRWLDATEAHRLGLVSRICAPGEAAATACELAAGVAAAAPLAVGAVMDLLDPVATAPDETTAFALQDAVVAAVFASADAVEGPAARRDRRPPRWSGR